MHNETLSVVAMCVSNPDRSPVGTNRCDAAPTPTGFAEIAGDDFQYSSPDIFSKLNRRRVLFSRKSRAGFCIIR
jgi:hypothetical protein